MEVVVATKLQGRPRTGISYDEANEFCTNRSDWITMIDYLEYCALQALCYIEYANFDNQATLNTNLTSDGFKQGGLGAGVTNLDWDRFLIKLELIKKLTIIRKEVVMGKIQIKLFVCFCLAVALITVLRLALVSFILIGFGQVLLLMSASLLQLNLIK